MDTNGDGSNMKKRIISIFFIFLLGIFTINNIYQVRADSGFGGSSGGGGSSSGGGGSSGSGGSSGGGLPDEVNLIIIVIMILLFIVLTIQDIKKKKQKREDLNSIHSIEIDEIRKIIPRFNLEKFRMEAYEIYKRIQIAWMNFDEEELRKYVTDEVYNMYVSQLKTLKIKDEQNVMKNFDLCNFSILDVKKEGKIISVKTNMQILCLDYFINTKNNETLRGYDNKRVFYNYEITFIKTNKYKEQNKYCPNCGAKITNNASNKCEYCDSIIVSNKYNWVMSNKEVVEQYYEDEVL